MFFGTCTIFQIFQVFLPIFNKSRDCMMSSAQLNPAQHKVLINCISTFFFIFYNNNTKTDNQSRATSAGDNSRCASVLLDSIPHLHSPPPPRQSSLATCCSCIGRIGKMNLAIPPPFYPISSSFSLEICKKFKHLDSPLSAIILHNIIRNFVFHKP